MAVRPRPLTCVRGSELLVATCGLVYCRRSHLKGRYFGEILGREGPADFPILNPPQHIGAERIGLRRQPDFFPPPEQALAGLHDQGQRKSQASRLGRRFPQRVSAAVQRLSPEQNRGTMGDEPWPYLLVPRRFLSEKFLLLGSVSFEFCRAARTWAKRGRRSSARGRNSR